MTDVITPVPTASMEAAPPLPPLAVDDIGEAYDLAVVENRGHDILVEKGISELGSTYLSYEKDGEVTYATAREAMIVCSHLASLSSRVSSIVIEDQRIDPKQIPGYTQNLSQLDA